LSLPGSFSARVGLQNLVVFGDLGLERLRDGLTFEQGFGGLA
jgi:hypothetical protein